MYLVYPPPIVGATPLGRAATPHRSPVTHLVGAVVPPTDRTASDRLPHKGGAIFQSVTPQGGSDIPFSPTRGERFSEAT
jgi:hypothetical protein